MRPSVLAAGLILALTVRTPAQQPADTWPPEGVQIASGPGIIIPGVVKEVKPLYTAAAMHAHVMGSVILDVVVETNGSVGPVRVKRSLDPTFGLDDEAVKAVKQWRFTPARKDGAPVRILVQVQLSFTTGDPTPRPVSLPAAFIREAGATRNPELDQAWSEQIVGDAESKITIGYPSSWLQVPSTSGNLLQVMGLRGASRFAVVMVLPLKSVPGSALSDGPPADKLQAFEQDQRARMAVKPSGPTLKGVGQARFGLTYWTWVEVAGGTTAEVPSPPGIPASLFRIDPIHTWVFNTTVDNRLIQVALTVVMPEGSAADQTESDERAAADVFARMLTRVTIESAP